MMIREWLKKVWKSIRVAIYAYEPVSVFERAGHHHFLTLDEMEKASAPVNKMFLTVSATDSKRKGSLSRSTTTFQEHFRLESMRETVKRRRDSLKRVQAHQLQLQQLKLKSEFNMPILKLQRQSKVAIQDILTNYSENDERGGWVIAKRQKKNISYNAQKQIAAAAEGYAFKN